MTLELGRRLGPYEVLSPLGAGGMGEVYRARDRRLGRDVALKVLPESVAADPDRRLRFEREARAVAALNHPGVLAIFDVGEADGIAFMVTEMLEGETLRERLARGPVPWVRAVSWGADLAEALAATHERGIVHRDLKPENLFLTRDGRPKVLDFGLAKETLREAGLSDPTLTDPTGAGRVLGTAGYLSPEQARAEPIDGRTDLFSLGCVVYEALTGRRAFAGKTPEDLLVAVLTMDPPDATSIRPEVPGAVSRLVQRCLAKDRRARFQSASDLAFALRSTTEGPSTTAAGVAPSWRAARAWLLAVGLGLAGLVVGSRLRSGAEIPEPLLLALTPGTNREARPAISPDGKFVAYLATEAGRTDVWVKFVGGGPGVNLTSKSGLVIRDWGPEISPDGRLIAVRAWPESDASYFQQGIWLVPAPLGGPPRKLLNRASGMRWSPDGMRVAYMLPDPAGGDSIEVARPDGTEARVVVPRTKGLHVHEPAFSHDGAWVYFTRGLNADQPPTEIWRVPSRGGAAERVVATRGVALSPEPTPDGLGLIYAGDRSGVVLNLFWRQLSNGRERRLTLGAGDYLAPRISADGRRLVCEARTGMGSLRQLDLGRREPGVGDALTAAGAGDAAPSTARTGRMAFSSARNGTLDIWVADGDGASARPLTSDPEDDSLPAISPDGTRVAFVSNRDGRRGLWLVSAQGGAPRSLVPVDVADRPSWSPDGRRLVYAAEGADAELSLWVVPADGGSPAPIPGVRGRRPIWSPKDDLIAYRASGEAETGLLTRFTTSGGQPREPRLDETLSSHEAAAFSWNGRGLALIALPVGGAPEVLVVDLESGRARTAVRLDPWMEVRGVAWTPDDTHLVYGLQQYQSRILLFDGLSP